jgi:hypothetical protein
LLKGLSDPGAKRKIMGKEFILSLRKQKKMKVIFAQGTFNQMSFRAYLLMWNPAALLNTPSYGWVA